MPGLGNGYSLIHSLVNLILTRSLLHTTYNISVALSIKGEEIINNT